MSQKTYIVENFCGNHSPTVFVQPVIGNVPLHHEFIGASDYCAHCGKDDNNPCMELERIRRKDIHPLTVKAFGCDKLASNDGYEQCKEWCQGENCPYTRSQQS